MSKAARKPVVIGLLLAPLLCCVIAVGAFLHVAVAFVEAQGQEQADRWNQVEKLAGATKDLEKQIAGLDQRIAELRRQLAEQRKRADVANQLEEELRRLREQKVRLEQELAELRKKLAKAKEMVAEGKKQVEKEREAKTTKQEKIRRKQEDVARAENNVARTDKEVGKLLSLDDLPGESSNDLQNQLAQKQQKLRDEQLKAEKLNAQLADLGKTPKAMEPTFVVERIKSTRRWNAPSPVYVECDGKGVLLQPEGMRLSSRPDASDIARFLGAAEKTRYVLFLIRPSGYRSYQSYCEILNRENGKRGSPMDYGYEPINEDWNLIYPNEENGTDG